jgi:hypothetical protein
MISPDVVKQALESIKRAVDYEYFFSQLKSPEWIRPLWDAGMFRSPRPPKEDERTIQFPFWPESRYLVRMAPIASPDEKRLIADVALQIPENANVRIHEDLAEIAASLPPELAAKFVSKAKIWIESRYQILLSDKLSSLVSHLARGGQVEAALDLTRSLLAVLPDPQKETKAEKAAKNEETAFLFSPEPRPHFDLWHYARAIRTVLPDLVGTAGLRALSLFCDLLDTAIRLSRRRDEDEGPEDFSYIWHPGIALGQSRDDDLKGALVFAVRAAAEMLIQNGQSVGELADFLEQKSWRVFHRVALYLLAEYADIRSEDIAKRIREPEKYDFPGIYREFFLLQEKGFKYLSPQDQLRILEWIDKGPDVELFKIRWSEFTGHRVSDEDAAKFFQSWQRDRLAVLEADLPEAWRERYARLLSLGPPENLTGLREVTGGAFAPESPVTSRDLRAMGIDELVEYLKSWQPASNHPMEKSMAGLGNQLSSGVASDPKRFSADANRFKDLDPTYIRSFVEALGEPAKNENLIDWKPVLDLCHWVLERPREIPGRKGGLLDRDPDWGWTRIAIARLLSSGLTAETIPYELRKQAWLVIEALTEDPDPTPDAEAQYLSHPNAAPLTLSINSTRGQAMDDVFLYALWVRRHSESQPDGGERLQKGFEKMPEVRRVLEKHLDPATDRSLTIRSVYGRRLPWLRELDASWLEANLLKIFPTNKNLRSLRECAWTTYVISCDVYNKLFDLLRPEYLFAVEQIGKYPDKSHLGHPDDRLAEHLVILYWRGNIDLSDELLAAFFTKASDGLRGHMIEYVGRSLRDTPHIPPETIERLKRLWDVRLDAAENSRDRSVFTEEMAHFGWWFASKKLPDDWAISQLKDTLKIAKKSVPDHLVVERLAELAPSMPLETVECLGMLAEGDKNGWEILGWNQAPEKILSTAMRSADQDARIAAIDLVHRLGALGHFQFRALLSGGASDK